MAQVQEQVDWSALQSLCHLRLLALHQRQHDSPATLRSLRWAVALLQRFDVVEPVLPHGPTSPLYGTPSNIDGAGGEFKLKAARHDISSSPGKKARQQVHLAGGSGEAGFRIAKTIEAQLALPHIFVLTKFVSHCLLVSLDQDPITTEAEEVMESDAGSWELNDSGVNLDWGPDGVDRTEDKAIVPGGLEQGMWLYKWLVKALLWVPTVAARGQDDLSIAPMDWLVAYLMLTDPTGVIRVVIEDLASELSCSKTKCSPIVLVYLRRISILEFAALRMPEKLWIGFSSSLPLVSVTRFKFAEESVVSFEEPRMISADCLASYTPSIWLVLASISRCLLHAFTLLWVPWDKDPGDIWLKLLRTCEGTTNLFPQFSEVFEGPKSEELQGVMSSWVCALLKTRLVELTPLAADLVVLLYNTAQSLKLQMDENLADISCQLLEVILGQLAQYLLPNCLGSHTLKYEGPVTELDGAALFLGNLKHNVYRLWDAILDASASCICPSCHGVRSDFFAVIDPSKNLCCCHSKKCTPRKLKGDYLDHPCWRKAEATFSEICQLVIMCCEDHVVTDLLVHAMAYKFCSSGDMQASSLKQVHTIMNVVQVLVAQGSRQHVVKAWAIKLRRLLPASSNAQILSMMSSLKLLLLPDTWQKHLWATKVYSGRLSLNEDNNSGLAWKSAWQLVQKVLDCEWHTFITLLDQRKEWDLKWSVLNVLQLLPVDTEAQSQGVILRLRSAIRVFFSVLQERDSSGYGTGNSSMWRSVFGNQWWHYVRITEQLKELIIDHAAVKFSCFVLMVDNMLDFSFVLSGLKKIVTAILPQQRGRLKPLSLKEGTMPELTPSWLRQCGITSPEVDNEGSQRSRQVTKQGASRMTTMVAKELGNLLRRTFEKGMRQARELHPCDCWPSHPATILATIMMSRLETPHEMPMTMEQYEEVLPRHVSSPRHTYLMECFNNNPLLFEILQMIFEHGGSEEATQCSELLRALLADSITQFHSAFRPRHPFSESVEGADLEVLARMDVSRLIQVVWSSGWLPESLACSKEIVHVVDREYIPDLLLLIWRCMHDSLAANAKKALEQDPTLEKDESQKDGVSEGWEVSFQSILRNNIVQVCAHVGHVYPGRK